MLIRSKITTDDKTTVSFEYVNFCQRMPFLILIPPNPFSTPLLQHLYLYRQKIATYWIEENLKFTN